MDVTHCPNNIYQKAERLCREQFSSNRVPSWNKAFSMFDTTPFEESCIREACKTSHASGHSNTIVKSVCNIAEVYRSIVFASKGMMLPVVGGACVHEKCPHSTMNHDFQPPAGGAHMSKLDLIVITNEHFNMGVGKFDKFRQRLDMLNAQLQQRFTSHSIRFGLVGFGGVGVHAPAHTTTFNTGAGPTGVWGERGVFTDLYATFINELASERFIGHERGSPLDAIRFVIDTYQFDPTAQKMIVLLTDIDRPLHVGDATAPIVGKLNVAGVTLAVFSSYTPHVPSNIVAINYGTALTFYPPKLLHIDDMI